MLPCQSEEEAEEERGEVSCPPVIPVISLTPHRMFLLVLLTLTLTITNASHQDSEYADLKEKLSRGRDLKLDSVVCHPT